MVVLRCGVPRKIPGRPVFCAVQAATGTRTLFPAMPAYINMPKLSDTMTEGTLLKWCKQKGDKIVAGDILAEIETDKATMEMQSFDDGILTEIYVSEGDKVADRPAHCHAPCPRRGRPRRPGPLPPRPRRRPRRLQPPRPRLHPPPRKPSRRLPPSPGMAASASRHPRSPERSPRKKGSISGASPAPDPAGASSSAMSSAHRPGAPPPRGPRRPLPPPRPSRPLRPGRATSASRSPGCGAPSRSACSPARPRFRIST